MADATLLQTFPTPAPAGSPLVIEHTAEEFTSLCPVTGHPDFGRMTVRYQPAPPPAANGCVELKSLKLYYQAYRNEGIFYEAVTHRIRDDLVRLMKPVWLQVISEWKGRGGIHSVVRADHGEVPPHYRGR